MTFDGPGTKIRSDVRASVKEGKTMREGLISEIGMINKRCGGYEWVFEAKERGGESEKKIV